jgi:hypothetical protein
MTTDHRQILLITQLGESTVGRENLEIGRILHFKSEIRKLKLDFATTRTNQQGCRSPI